MIYTCYEMIRDCREDRPAGWSYLVSYYVPVMRKLLAHYSPGDESRLEPVLLALRKPELSLFQSLEPAPERWFLAELRQKLLAELPPESPQLPLDLETVARALEPLTVVEKQVAWIDTMRYPAAETGAMLRMAPATVEKIRTRAAELIRGQVDSWRPTLLSENGRELGRSAAATAGAECLPAKTFLDVLDGRMTWLGREQMERHVATCWNCVDHFCRLVEVVEVIRGVQPLTPAEAEPYRRLLNLPAEKKTLLGRWFGA